MGPLLQRPAVLAAAAVVTVGVVAGSVVGLTTGHDRRACTATAYHGRYVPLNAAAPGRAYGSTLHVTTGNADFGWYAYSPLSQTCTVRISG